MKKIPYLIILLALALITTSCGHTETVPITEREHTLLVSDEELLEYSTQEYRDFLKQTELSDDEANTAMVKRVGKRLADAVEKYMRENGREDEIEYYDWEFCLTQDEEVNAFCMPGGKIVVFEGILPVTQDEESLAVVLGHEVAHAVAKHSAEQISEQMRQEYGVNALSLILGPLLDDNVNTAFNAIASTGLSLFSLKYDRAHELEADHMGLIFTAMAGYDPQCAIPFWERMEEESPFAIEFLSDHPDCKNRIKAIRKHMPQAMEYYNKAANN